MLRRSLRPTLHRTAGALAALALTSVLTANCRESAPARAEANTVLGVGGTFPAPLYTLWAQDYRTRTGVAVNYQGIGSGPATQQILEKTVDFGATDAPMTPDQLTRTGLYQFPTVIGGVTPVVNLPGVTPGQLRLTGALLGDIYMGAVTRWNDPRIVALNPGLRLPAEPIAVVYRAQPSGTTFLFTSYLSMVNPVWKAKAGAGDTVAWPAGVSRRGTGGVVAFVEQTPGAIGNVEYAYAKQANLAYVLLQNRDGAFVAPSAATFAAAAAGADWGSSAANDVLLLNKPGAGSWPITGATFILVYRRPEKPPKTRQVLAFFDWAYKSGDASAANLDYVPLPKPAKDLMRRQWATTIRDDAGQPVYAPGP